MKKITLLILLATIIYNSGLAQIRLDIEGEAKIEKRLILGNTTDFNMFVGYDTGINTIPDKTSFTGLENTFIGNMAGKENTTGSYNVFVGFLSGHFNTSGTRNTFIGNRAGYANTTASNNVFIGDATGQTNTTGNHNTFLGQFAGGRNTIGNQNIFIGSGAGAFNTDGIYNTFIGTYAGLKSTGNWNTYLGWRAGDGNTSGRSNTFIGTISGDNNTTGESNTCLGAYSNLATSDLDNATAIGFVSIVDASNKVVIGNTSVTVIGGSVNWMNLSDKRYKKNIKKEKNHLDFILQLEPVSYQYNTTKLVKEQQQKAIATSKAISRNQKSDNTKISSAEDQVAFKNRNANELKAAEQKDKIRYSGFLAQEVEKAANKVGYGEFSGIVKPEINGGKYGLRYAEFVVPLVGAVQEQQSLISAQQQQITQRDEEIVQLIADVTELKEMLQTIIADQKTKTTQSAIIQSAELGQNAPNPFNGITKIPYFIPTTTQQASLLVYNLNGQLLKSIAIQNFGKGSLELQTNELSNGQYTYSLEIDGRVVSTKKMNLVK